MELRNENSSGAWLTSYNKYLRDVVGATAATCVRHSRVVRRFIDICFERGTAGWAELSIERMAEFIREDTASKKGHGRRAPACAIRSFLRFLAWRGVVPSRLDRAIPRIRLSRHASLPPHLSSDQLAQLLDGAKSAGTAARRDLAILLLLARLGLRAAEIVALQIDDIDWRTGLLRVRVGKSRRERVLPLPHEVGDALADYVQHDRPSHLSRGMFFTISDPPRSFRDPTAITRIVQRNLVRAGIPVGRLTGAHMLRHTAATRMVNGGASFREVADLLGHQSLQTTAIYAKLNLEALACVALPWIGGKP